MHSHTSIGQGSLSGVTRGDRAGLLRHEDVEEGVEGHEEGGEG